MPGPPAATESPTAGSRSRIKSKEIAIRNAIPPAMMMFVGKLRSPPRKIGSPRPPPSGEDRQGRDRHRADGGDPEPGDDLRGRQRHLDLPEHLPLGQAHSAGGVLGRLGHVREPGDRVAVDDLQGVGAERDDRGVDPAPGERQQQEEEGDAGDRVEDPGRRQQRRLQPVAAMGESARAKAIAKPITTESTTSFRCCRVGVP